MVAKVPLKNQENSANSQQPSGPQIFFRPAPEYVDAMFLAASVNEDYTVPANANYLIFSANADFYVKKGGTAAVPSTEVADGSGSEMNPVGYSVEGGETLGFIAPAADTVVTISVYSDKKRY